MYYNDLAVFAVVARTLSFVEASRRLGIPASRVSRRVAELEDRLGVKLFERTTRRVRLTEEGATLFDRCDAPLEMLDGAVRAGRDGALDSQGGIRATAPPLAARRTIGPLLLEFMAAHPGISIELITTNTNLDFVRDGVDVAFRLGPLDESELVARPLWQVDYCLCVGVVMHERYALTDCLSRARFEELPTISIGQPWRLREVSRYEPKNVRHVLDDLELAQTAVAAGQGASFLPLDMLTPDMAVLDVEDLTPVSRGMYVVYPSSRLLPHRVRRLVDHVVSASKVSSGSRRDARLRRTPKNSG